ncbi:effector-associated domain 2-containing protein [Actinomadura sp. HBU206391]|uniref:effector-associated domain 2-containing protein n=1 Tax=Actinomadura sp. HBU206391 TaxID=2731692 RepID=UPI00164FFB79|nr:hypothetical protein [Actinomadura sp. HBU206391]MBC6459877.1 hypothetical protein [Actinomadura sp. HBU206391]
MIDQSGPAGGGVARGPSAAGGEPLFAFVNTLTSLPSLTDDSGRATLVSLLPPALAASAQHDPRPRIHLFNLVLACLDHEGGLADLLAALSHMEGDSLPMRRALRAAAELTGRPAEAWNDHGG